MIKSPVLPQCQLTGVHEQLEAARTEAEENGRQLRQCHPQQVICASFLVTVFIAEDGIFSRNV